MCSRTCANHCTGSHLSITSPLQKLRHSPVGLASVQAKFRVARMLLQHPFKLQLESTHRIHPTLGEFSQSLERGFFGILF